MPRYHVPFKLEGYTTVHASDPAAARVAARETDKWILADASEQVFITGDPEPAD